MDVYQAVTSRRAVRGFTGEPVPREVIERVLRTAGERAPSGSNLVHVPGGTAYPFVVPVHSWLNGQFGHF